jgi:hypothetical protein
MHLHKLAQSGITHLLVPAFFIVAVGGIGVYVLALSHAATGDTITSGIAGKCLDDWQSSSTNGNKADLYTCNKTGAQQWTETASHQLKNNNGACLDNWQAKNANRNPIKMYSCSTSTTKVDPAEVWEAYEGGFRNPATGKCLNDPGSSTTNGTELILYTCVSSEPKNQVWTVIAPASGGGGNGGGSTTAPTPTPTPTPTPPTTSSSSAKYAPPTGKAYLGWSGPVGNISAFDKAAGITTQPAIYNGYTAADGDMNPIISMASSTNEAPMISWNVTMSGGAITNGSEDSYLEKQAAEAKAYGKPIFIRLDWEMNGTWYSNYDNPSTTPAEYIASWQHIYNIFKTDAPNAAFVWCPNVGDPNGMPADDWYPGDSYVDWVALDAYPEFSNPATTVVTETDGMDDFATFAAAHNKPLMLAEWALGELGSDSAPDNSAVMDIVFGWANKYPDTVGALVYFDNVTQGTDFTLESHPNAAASFRSYTGSGSRYILTVNQ